MPQETPALTKAQMPLKPKSCRSLWGGVARVEVWAFTIRRDMAAVICTRCGKRTQRAVKIAEGWVCERCRRTGRQRHS
jgi:hypothetical protein